MPVSTANLIQLQSAPQHDLTLSTAMEDQKLNEVFAKFWESVQPFASTFSSSMNLPNLVNPLLFTASTPVDEQPASTLESAPGTSATSTPRRPQRRTMKGSKTSPVWKYFHELPEKAGKCKFCGKVLKATFGNTTGMISHLKSFHKLQYSEFQLKKTREAKAPCLRDPNLPSESTSMFMGIHEVDPEDKENTTPPAPESEASKEDVDRQVALFLMAERLPLAVAESPGFCALIKLLRPSYVIPTVSQLRNDIFPQLEAGLPPLFRPAFQQYMFNYIGDGEAAPSLSSDIDGN